MPLLRSSSTGPKEVRLDVRIPRPPQEEAILVPRKGQAQASSGGAIRSAGKSKAGRQASKSPYVRPKQATAGPSSQVQPIPQSVTHSLQNAMDAMLIGPVSARTRLRQKMFLKRPAQSALANALVPPPQPAASSSLRPGPSVAGTGLRATTAARSQPPKPQPRLVDPSTHTAASTSTSTQGAAVLPPREALAEARRKKASASSSSNAAAGRKGVAPKTAAAAAAAYAVNYPQTSSLASTRASMRLADGRAADEGARTVRIRAA